MRNITRGRIMYEGSILSACYHMVSALRVGIPGPGLSCGSQPERHCGRNRAICLEKIRVAGHNNV